MSGAANGEVQGQVPAETAAQESLAEDRVHAQQTDHDNQNEENSVPSVEQEEELIKKKYGGILPKKPPLISKDHERAFFDSADWALGKQGAQKLKGPLESLRPKLQPTPHHKTSSRRLAYASCDGEDVTDKDINNSWPEDCASDGVVVDDNKNTAPTVLEGQDVRDSS